MKTTELASPSDSLIRLAAFVPTKPTLKKYGLTAEEFLAILSSQGNKCPICGKVPSTGRFVIDHEHVRGWKNMPPQERKKYVRGITCWWCNSTYLGRGITVEKAENVATYLINYRSRREQQKLS